MHTRRLALGVLCLLLTARAQAESPPDPLRLVPRQADFFIQAHHPRRLVETVLHLDALAALRKLDAVREQLDSTDARRFYQLVAYFEKELGHPWPELLDRLAGGGIVLAGKFGPDPAPVLLVIQGTDNALAQKFFTLARDVVAQELARQESKLPTADASYEGTPVLSIGPQFHAARVGPAILASNQAAILHMAIDRAQNGGKDSLAGHPGPSQAKRLLPANALLSAWLNLDTLHHAPGANETFELPRNQFLLTLLFGGWLDVARRAPFLAAALAEDQDGLLVTARMPAGRQGMPAALAAHVPPAGGPASLPLLEPPGVLFSTSYFLDASQFWSQRQKLFTKEQVKQLEEFDKNSGRYLLGNRFSRLLTQAGTHHRIVAVHAEGYRALPKAANRRISFDVPATALVVDLREPEAFDQAMNGILRGAALLAGTQVKLKLAEEDYAGHHIVSYQIQEDSKSPIVKRLPPHFSPSFVRVGDQFVVSSTAELARTLIDLLKREKKDAVGPPASQTQLYAEAAASALAAVEDQLFAQTVLAQALPPDEARAQVKAFTDWVRRLGRLRLESNYRDHEFRYDVRLPVEFSRSHPRARDRDR